MYFRWKPTHLVLLCQSSKHFIIGSLTASFPQFLSSSHSPLILSTDLRRQLKLQPTHFFPHLESLVYRHNIQITNQSAHQPYRSTKAFCVSFNCQVRSRQSLILTMVIYMQTLLRLRSQAQERTDVLCPSARAQ